MTAAVSDTDEAAAFWRHRWIPAALFLLLSTLYFSDVVLKGSVVRGLDVGTDYHLGEDSVEERLGIFLPPVWNPKMGGYAQSGEMVHHYFPTHLINLVTSFHRHIAWRYLLTMFVAGLGMYAYIRELRSRRAVAVWTGVAYMSAPTFLSFPYAGHYAKMSVIALLPVMFTLLERGMNSGRAVHFALLALLIAVGVYSPHLQMLYHALWAIGFYFIYKAVVLLRHRHHGRTLAGRAGLFGLAVTLGLGLGSEGLVPPYLFAKAESTRAVGEPGGSGIDVDDRLDFAHSWSLHPEEVAALLIPEFGGFMSPSGDNRYWGRNDLKLNAEYFGVLVLLLAILSLWQVRSNRLVLFMWCLFLFAVAYALGPRTPVHWIFFRFVPGVEVLRAPGMVAFLFAFAACVLASQGLGQLLRIADAGAPLGLLVVGGVISGLALVVAVAPEAVTNLWVAVLYSDIEGAKLARLTAGHDWLSRGAYLVAATAAAGTVLLYFGPRWKPKPWSCGMLVAGLCVLTIADTWRINRQFLIYDNPRARGDIRDENRDVLAFLNDDPDPYRVFPLPDFKMLERPGYHLFGVNMVTGSHAFTPRRYDRVLREFNPALKLWETRYYKAKRIAYTNEEILDEIQSLLKLLNAKYIAAPIVSFVPIEIDSPVFPKVFVGGRFRIYENKAAMPWHYLVPSYDLIEGEEEAIVRLLAAETDLRQTAVLERPPPGEMAPNSHTGNDKIERQEYDTDNGYVRLRTWSDGPRILIASENYHSDWRAFVDGVPTDLMRANYVWQGVYVPAGDHLVELRYQSDTVILCRWLMLISGIAIALILGMEWRLRARTCPDAER